VAEIAEIFQQNRDLFPGLVVEGGAVECQGILEATDEVLDEILVRGS